MVALKHERRVFLWHLTPRPNPLEANVAVALEEILQIFKVAFDAKRARAYLSDVGGLLEDGDEKCDEKNQIYIAKIRPDEANKTVTILINRGDPNAVSPAFINHETNAVRVEHPKPPESPGWSAHLVISTTLEGGQHRACFEQMPHVSSHLVTSLFDKIVTAAIATDLRYTYEVSVKKGKKVERVRRRYRPMLATARVPSEKLNSDLEKGELSSVTLTRRKEFYTGVGSKDLIARQQEKIVIGTKPADKSKVAAFVSGLTSWAKEEKFEEISFKVENLPGGVSSSPTLTLDDHDAMEQLYVRAQRLTEFTESLVSCYPDICPAIEEKMIAVVNGSHGW